MVLNQLLKRLVLATLVAGFIAPASAAVEGELCGLGSDECLSSCKRFKEADPRRTACNNVCRPKASHSVDRCATAAAEVAVPLVSSVVTQALTESSAGAVVTEAPIAAVTEAPNESASESTSESTSESVSESASATAVEAPAESRLADSDPVNSQPDQVASDQPPSAQPAVDGQQSGASQLEGAQVSATSPGAPAQPAAQNATEQKIATPTPAFQPSKPQPTIPPLAIKRAMVKELEKNAEMLERIKAGNLNAIRRLIEAQGLSPTYAFGYEYNPQTRLFEGRVTRLRLSDIFADSNTLRTDSAGLDRIQALFLELGMDVKATLVVTVPTSKAKHAPLVQREITAWGPNLKVMYGARDRDARLRAFEMTLQAGLMPNEDFGAWLFAELPQVCGRDRSQFSIQVVDLLIKYLLPTLAPPSAAPLQDYFWRIGDHGPETIADVLDHATAPAQPKNSYEKAQYALLDDMWEQCVPLSRRINRFLVQGK